MARSTVLFWRCRFSPVIVSFWVILLVLVGGSVLAACGREQSGSLGAGYSKAQLQVKGSDTEVNLVQRLAEEFMLQKQGVEIAVSGGGSGTGIAALINGTTDIANSSREMKEDEVKQARDRGVAPVQFVFAMDGLSVIVHEQNPLVSLDLETIGRIFRGEITSWQEVGGREGRISLYGRQSNSGTFVFFRDVVLRGDYSRQMKGMNGSAQIVAGIKADVQGIGYVGIGYVADQGGQVIPGVKVLEVALNKGLAPVSPLIQENITSGLYPITRPLFHYTNSQPQGKLQEFLAFELSPPGQAIVRQEGFYPVAAHYLMENTRNLGGR